MIGDSFAQISQEGQTTWAVLIEGVIIEGTPFMLLFGDIHRHVSTPEKGHRITAMCRVQRDTNARFDLKWISLDQKLLLECSEQGRSGLLCACLVGGCVE